MMDSLDAGAEDFEADDGIFVINTAMEDFAQVRDTLLDKGYKFVKSDLVYEPSNYVKINDESNVDKMEKNEVLISEIIEYALDILRKSIDEKNIKIIFDYEDSEIKVDYYWVSEALINIIKNALSLDRLTKIKISTNKNPIYTEIIIEDDGGGIKEENFKKIFERFYKSPDSKGFGIGLAMAKSIIEANNGDISVKNGNDGAIFKIKFYNVT